MTKEYAKLILPHNEDDDLDEIWEVIFFKQINYFLTHAPIPLVWQSKLKKLNNEYTAYLTLTDQTAIQEEITSIFSQAIQYPENFLEAFHVFQTERSQQKRQVIKTQNPHELTNIIEQWLKVETDYATYWSHPICLENDIKVAQSQEPDPMTIIADLSQAEIILKSTSIHCLKENYNILPEGVKKEVKRLTLLAKK
ncbi:MAG: hypothetical protein H3C31_07875 [Brumimicrobium sp.]|nr:hypothetical protein [Brumimicrobium sp.]MCO5267997.1 hypothetical protein [Brumimicrobium sp.]